MPPGAPKTKCFRTTLPGVFRSVGTLLLFTYRQIEAKTQGCITFPRTKKQGVSDVERLLAHVLEHLADEAVLKD